MIRVALVGLGKMGLSHLAIVRSHPLVELVAVCDAMGFMVDILSRYTGIKTYTDYRQLLANEKLDALVVATPSRFHAEIVHAALERGLHVFCEKPFCLDLDEAKDLVARADSKRVVNQVGYHFRFVGSMREARRLVEAGAIGTVHHVRAEAYGPVVLRSKGTTWRARRVEGGGCLYDYASHAIDLLNYLVGPPTRVSAAVLRRIFSADVDDEVYATLHYDNGITGELAANWSDESFRKMSIKVSIWGTEGRINADRQEIQIYCRGDRAVPLGLNSGWNVRHTTELTEQVWYYLRGEEYSAQMAHFLAQIDSGRPDPTFSFRSAVEADAVIHQIEGIAGGEEAAVSAAPSRSRAHKGLLERVLGR